MKRIVSLLLFTFIVIQSFSQIFECSETGRPYKIGEHIYYLEDKKGQYSLDEVLGTVCQASFKRNEREVFVRPMTESVLWFKFSVRNLAGEELWLDPGTLYARDIVFFSPVDSVGGYHGLDIKSIITPANNLEYHDHKYRFKLFDRGDKETKTFYLKIKEDVPFELPLQVGTLSALNQSGSLNGYLAAGFIGAILIMILYNSFLWFSTREKLYFIYILYLFFVLISATFQNNFPFLTFGVDYQLWHQVLFARLGITLIMVGVFAIVYLNMKTELKLIYRLLISVMSGLGLLGVVLIFERTPLLIDAFQLLVGLMFVLCLYSAYLLMYRHKRQAIYYALGWTFMLIATIVYILTINGFIHYNVFTRNATYFGITVEAWFFSLALADRLNTMRKEKEQAQLTLMEKIVENERMIRQQNDILELRVKDRTRELQEKSDTIASQTNDLIQTLAVLNQQNKEIAEKNERLNQLSATLNEHYKVLENQTEQLKMLNLTKDKFFSILAHDLMNPLNALLGYSNLLNEALNNKEYEESNSYARIIDYSAQRISWLLQNLLVWSRSQREKIVPVPRVTNIHEMISESINITSPAATFKNIVMQVDLEKDLRAYFDYNMISTVVRNLILSAIKYSQKGGVVSVTVKRMDQELLFRIGDSGNGMENEVARELFSTNSLLSQKGSNVEIGTGLGLAIGKEFVEIHGGRIWADSSPGKGSDLCFTIPINLSSLN